MLLVSEVRLPVSTVKISDVLSRLSELDLRGKSSLSSFRPTTSDVPWRCYETSVEQGEETPAPLPSLTCFPGPLQQSDGKFHHDRSVH